jgi:hypothetical protein
LPELPRKQISSEVAEQSLVLAQNSFTLERTPAALHIIVISLYGIASTFIHIYRSFFYY